MSVRITGVAACRQELADLERFVTSTEPMRGIIDEVKAGVIEKTAAGHDYMGRNFAPYSDAYKKRRKDKGLSTKPDLNVTGTMIGAIRTNVINPNHGQVFVAPVSEGRINADMLAQIHNTGTGKQPERRFMDITTAGLKKIVKKHWDDKIMEIVRRYR